MKHIFQAANKNMNLRGGRQERHKRLVSDNTDDEMDATAEVAQDDKAEATKLASATAQKTRELGASVNESVIRPTSDKVKDGKLLNDMSMSMSSFANKLSSVGSKGWKDMSSLFSDKPRGADSGPGEGTSLLGAGGVGRNRGDYNELNKAPLMEGEKDDDDWSGWGEDWGSKQQSEEWGSWSNEQSSPNHSAANKKTTPTDDGWNNDDWNSSFDTAATSKKPLTSKPAMSKNQKNELKPKRASEPATANLIDFDGTSSKKKNSDWGNDDWNNEVWAEDDDDDWQSLEVSSKTKLKS